MGEDSPVQPGLLPVQGLVGDVDASDLPLFKAEGSIPVSPQEGVHRFRAKRIFVPRTAKYPAGGEGVADDI